MTTPNADGGWGWWLRKVAEVVLEAVRVILRQQ